MKKHPNRISVWIPKMDAWIFDVLEKQQLRAERYGLPTSKSDLIREALRIYFGEIRKKI